MPLEEKLSLDIHDDDEGGLPLSQVKTKNTTNGVKRWSILFWPAAIIVLNFARLFLDITSLALDTWHHYSLAEYLSLSTIKYTTQGWDRCVAKSAG